MIMPSAVDLSWRVSAAWFSDNPMPPSFSAAEVVPERSVQMFAARDPAAKVAVVWAVVEARRLASPDKPELVPVAIVIAVERVD